MNLKLALATIATVMSLLLTACDDNADVAAVPTTTQAQLLLEQFGALRAFFSEESMQALLDFENTGSPVVLVQLMSVTDAVGFANYETEAEALWQSVGARTQFASEVVAQLIGDRSLAEVRTVEFPNVMMLLDAMNKDQFSAAMNMLAASSDDHAWVLGMEDPLPFEPSGSYFDPALQNLDADEAADLLTLNAGVFRLDSTSDVILDMLVSDSPSPFWMVNLIKFYDAANYADGRETDLTGAEANAIYGQAIVADLLAYNSLPEMAMPVSVVLTQDSVKWEQAVIVRYASRDAFLNIFPLNPHAGDALVHKEAGVENTLVYVTEMENANLPAPAAGPFYNFRYCEVLLATFNDEGVQADVYNSIGQSTCPQDEWDALDALAIADEFAVDAALLNGIRFWVLDRIQVNQMFSPEIIIEEFGEISMRLAASVQVPSVADTGEGGGYRIAQVDRDTVFHYVAGRQMYELRDPEGQRYMMQSFSRVVDKALQLKDLQNLGRRLDLPPGWSFSTRVLEADFALATIDGVAFVVTDDLNNTYQRIP